MAQSLKNILENYLQVDLKDFFKKVLEYGKNQLVCDEGAAFLFDRATGLIKLRADTWEGGGRHFSLSPGIGLAGKAFETKSFFCIRRYDQGFIPPPFFPIGKLFLGVAFPVVLDSQVETVFCFYFREIDNTTEKKVQQLWEEFKKSNIGRAARRMQLHGIPGKIHQAGQSTAHLTTKVSDFILGLQKSFVENGWEKPNLIYVQLKDTARNLIQTVQNYSEPNKLHISSSHSLSANDINVDIMRTRSVEIISGYDSRFDVNIFNAYNHKNYTRIFIPLFPFPLGELSIENAQILSDHLAQIMIWKAVAYGPKNRVRQEGCWKKGHVPPKELVYGVLEIGYRLNNPDSPSLGIWTPEFTMKVMALAYRQSISLFRVTLPGVMDRIGRLLASTPFTQKVVFDCLFSSKRLKERRCYPLDTKWPVALPQLMRDEDSESSYDCEALNNNEVLPYNGKAVFICFAASSPATQSTKDIWNQNANAAEEAVETAFKLYETVMAPIMLIEKDKDRENVGTFIEDDVVKTLIKDAARSNGAEYAAFYSFEDPEQYGIDEAPPPVTWIEKDLEKFDAEKVKAYAYEAAKEQSYGYEPTALGRPVCFLPIGLKARAVGVIAMGFRHKQPFEPVTRMDLERQSLLWRHSILLHRLILKKRFHNLMMHRRRDIRDAHKKASELLEKEPNLNSLNEFIKLFLSSTTTNLAINAAVIALFNPKKEGMSRLRIFWSDMSNDAHEYELFSIEEHPSCKAFLRGDTVEILMDDELDYRKSAVVQFLSDYQRKLEKSDKQANLKPLERFSMICQNTSTQSVLVIPVHPIGNGFSKKFTTPREKLKGWCYLLMEQKQFFREIHKQLALELGQQIGRAIGQVRVAQEEAERETLEQKAKIRIDSFDEAHSINDIIHGFLKGLGRWSGNNQKKTDLKEADYFDIAEHAVVWTYSKGRKELVARSGRGKALDAICSTSLDIRKSDQHPVFNNITCPRKDYPRLKDKERFKFQTVDLSSVNVPEIFKPLYSAYQAQTGLRWLISFPMVDPSDKIFGAFDLIRDRPLDADSEQVLEQVFLRISRRLNSQAEKIRLKQVGNIMEKLFVKAKDCIERSKLFPVYNELAVLLREEFNCAQCDIFVEMHDKFYLYGSTHPLAPRNDRERAMHWFQKTKVQGEPFDRAEIFDRALESKRPCIAHEWDPKQPLSNFSGCLKQFLARVKEKERLIIPLKSRKEVIDRHIDGLVQLHGPSQLLSEGGQKVLKKNRRFLEEHVLLGRDIGLQFSRIIRMLQLAEQQIWLVNEIAHSLAQPLQGIRSDMNNLIRELMSTDVDFQKIRIMTEDTGQSYEMIHEALNQVSYFTGKGLSEWKYRNIKLKQLLVDCCTFMSKTARLRNLLLDYSQLNEIREVPIEQAWMRKAILNLLHNACKYSWEAEHIEVSLEEKDSDIFIEVVNWGIGIPKEEQDKIFNAYFRSMVDDRYGVRPGTGIGLSIARTAIESVHEGRIEGKSELEHGRYSSQAEKSIENKRHRTCFKIILNRKKLNELLKKGNKT